MKEKCALIPVDNELLKVKKWRNLSLYIEKLEVLIKGSYSAYTYHIILFFPSKIYFLLYEIENICLNQSLKYMSFR